MRLKILSVLFFFCPFLSSATDTVLKLYRPFGEVSEQIAPVVKKKLLGQCKEQSQRIAREDAWRCRAEEQWFDPCFVQQVGTQQTIICPQSPWVEDSVQIEVSTSLNNAQHNTLDMSRAFPWAIELVNGERCQAIEPDAVYDNMPVRYRCNPQHVLIGHLQRCKPVWSILEKTPEGVATVDLKKAWF